MTERIDKVAEAARGQDELKRCPSDGEKAKRSSRETAWLNGRGYDKEYCTECGVCGFATRYYDTPEEADAAWNRRCGEDGWEAEQAYAKLYGTLQKQHFALLDAVKGVRDEMRAESNKAYFTSQDECWTREMQERLATKSVIYGKIKKALTYIIEDSTSTDTGHAGHGAKENDNAKTPE